MAISPSALLQLPGELRNRIYMHCISAEPIKVSSLPYANPTLQDSLFGPCGNLQYACRQIQEEFGPILRAETVLCVKSTSLSEFLSAVYPNRHSAQGNIMVETKRPYHLNVTPLLRLSVANPKFKIEITIDVQPRGQAPSLGTRLNNELRAFHTSLASGILRLDLEDVVQSVCLTSGHAPTMEILLMDNKAVEEVCGDDTPKKWLTGRGGPRMDGFRVMVRGGGEVRCSRLYEGYD